MEYQTIRNKKHYVYDDESEFYDVHPPETKIVKDWKHGKEGEWVYSDDGRIVQLLKVADIIPHPHDRKVYTYAQGYVRTIVGTFLRIKGSKMDTDFSKHVNRYTFSGKNPKSMKERKSCTNREKIFATNVAVGMGPVKAYMDAYRELPEIKARPAAALLLRQDRVMKEIEKSVLDVAKQMGLDHKYVLNKLKCLADGSSDDNIVLQSTKELGKIIGTTGNTIKQREMGIVGMFQGFSPKQLEGAERPSLEIASNSESEVIVDK
ncbi:MAG: hypothetical protein H8D80_01425 [Proteobacteria bacterium]|nr:hypothetical protein [Pseudomonadota bacterium]